MRVWEQISAELERDRKRDARRLAAQRRADARPPCRICGGRMSAPRNGWSHCQGGNSIIQCGMWLKISNTVEG